MFFVMRGKRILAVLLCCLVAAGAGVALLWHPADAQTAAPEVRYEQVMAILPAQGAAQDESQQGTQAPAPSQSAAPQQTPAPSPTPSEKKYIKWVEFNVPYEVLDQALKYDIQSHGQAVELHWIELMAYAAAKNGGSFKANKRSGEIEALVEKLQGGARMEDLTREMKYYPYYLEAYTSILAGFVGEYKIEAPDPNDEKRTIVKEAYGLKAFSPIAKGYGFGHYEDFGSARSYGYKRVHLGNDLMGSVGTPIIAVEGGTVEALGWNQYGGWRVGIRSDDTRRYYYYAHLRKDHPYPLTLKEGDRVEAGDVIGYLGMTGYSTKENVNNINEPHLHFGLQLIFDESQKEGTNQIWVDVYHLINLLQKNKSAVVKDEATKDYSRVYHFVK
nr:M23 family metallopeptidase [Maliibacterium massiliense]